jgi:hypothetical protein
MANFIVLISDHLDLNVARFFDILFKVKPVIAKCTCRFAPSIVPCLLEL